MPNSGSSLDVTHGQLVEQSLGLLCYQYLASALSLNHQTKPSSKTLKKHTLSSRYLPSVSPYLTGGLKDLLEYENIRNDHNHETVLATIQNQTPSLIQQEILPIVQLVEKKTLPRAYRTALSQLRWGYCRALNSFQNLLDPSTPITRPDCDSGETHTTQHLFRCPTQYTSDRPRCWGPAVKAWPVSSHQLYAPVFPQRACDVGGILNGGRRLGVIHHHNLSVKPLVP